MKVYLSVFILVFLVFTSLRTHAEESRSSNPPTNHKFEDLFIWKVSDELKLSVPEEKAFSDLVRGLNQKKTDLNEQMQVTLKKLALAKDKKERDKALSEYKTEVKKIGKIAIDEVDQIKKVLGTEKAAQYFVLKNDLANQFKAKLVNPEPDKSKSELPAPKVIEEQ